MAKSIFIYQQCYWIYPMILHLTNDLRILIPTGNGPNEQFDVQIQNKYGQDKHLPLSELMVK